MLLVISFVLLNFCGTCCLLLYASEGTTALACPNNTIFIGAKSALTVSVRNRNDIICKNMSKVVITMSRGRSGSTYISEVMSHNLIGEHTNVTEWKCALLDSFARSLCTNFCHILGPSSGAFSSEILGSDSIQMKDIKNPLGVIQERICAGNPNVYKGFKWKPSYWDDTYVEALRWVAFHQIPVILNHRNPIDVYLSLRKHNSAHVIAHCKVGETACIDSHMQNQLISVDVKNLIRLLIQQSCDFDNTKSLLDRENVKYIDITFESVTAEYNNNQTVIQNWRRVFEFIDPAATWHHHLNMQNLAAAIAPTSSTAHRDKIRNYDEVKEALKETRFARLLN